MSKTVNFQYNEEYYFPHYDGFTYHPFFISSLEKNIVFYSIQDIACMIRISEKEFNEMEESGKYLTIKLMRYKYYKSSLKKKPAYQITFSKYV